MKLLVVSPHPDDETLGAGGTLLKYKAAGNSIFWLNITNMKENYGYSAEVVALKQNQIDAVKEMYRMDGFYDLKLQPAHLEQYESGEIIKQISGIIEEIQPNLIILPNRSDAHSDHKRVFDWCYASTKVFRHPYIHTILSMEILSETDFGIIDDYFIPNYYIGITDHLKNKLDILQLYQQELGSHPFPRSLEGVEAIAKVRGIAAGTFYAEAFKVIKMILE